MQLLKLGVARGEISVDADLEAATSVLHTLTVAIGDSRMIASLDAYLQLHASDDAAQTNVRALIAIALNGVCAKVGA